MKSLLIITSTIFLLYSCANKNQTLIELDRDSLCNVLMKTDSLWSETAGQIGYNKSRVRFSDNDAINIMNGEMPLVGKNMIAEYASSHPDTGYTISWKPVTAGISQSGDMGYTYGGWTLNTKNKSGRDTTLFGNYLTVWKKQSDGNWKYLADGGGATPKEIK